MLRKYWLQLIAILIVFVINPVIVAAEGVQPIGAAKTVKMQLEVTPWQLSPSGGWRAMAKIYYLDASGNVVEPKDYKSGFLISGAEQRTLANWVNHGRSALINLNRSSSVKVKAWSANPKFNSIIKWLPAPPNDLAHFEVVANNVGPYANAIAWTPLAKNTGVKNYQLWRIHDGQSKLVTNLSLKQTHFFDATGIQPHQHYQYMVKVMSDHELKNAKSGDITAMAALPSKTISNFRGKGVFLTFSPKENDPNSYRSFPISKVISQAKKAKLDFIELQLQYGEYPRIKDAGVKTWYEGLLDAAHENNIKVIAWVTPCVANIETIRNTIQSLDDQSSRGNSLDGVALDIEPGDSFMGDNTPFPNEAVKLISEFKAAVGRYPLTVIVPSPHILNNYPYAQMANYVDLVAPMIFWHHHDVSKHFHYNYTFVDGYCRQKINVIKDRLKKPLPLLIVAQSADLGDTGIPSSSEINWAMQSAKRTGAIGVAFFDWGGMHRDLWNVLGHYDFV